MLAFQKNDAESMSSGLGGDPREEYAGGVRLQKMYKNALASHHCARARNERN